VVVAEDPGAEPEVEAQGQDPGNEPRLDVRREAEGREEDERPEGGSAIGAVTEHWQKPRWEPSRGAGHRHLFSAEPLPERPRCAPAFAAKPLTHCRCRGRRARDRDHDAAPAGP